MKHEVTEARRALEEQLCKTLNIDHLDAVILLERMIDFFKAMRSELRKHDER